ncbi:MAG: transketolase [Planctomycetota bacterium]
MNAFGTGAAGEALAELAVNTLRFLSADAVQAADSGHPGLPMGAADLAHVLWTKFLRVDPADPLWINRDRFALSAGHGSALLYSLLHLAGFDLSLDDLKAFRQYGSKTPGHPEFGHTPGVDTTSGPLGAGFTNAVGFALAERMLAERFNTPGHPLIDHYTYVLASDGCFMEGVTSEAASLAGHLGLGKLICLYDDNEITIEGPTDLAFTEDVNGRFEAYGWHVQDVGGHDCAAVENALRAAQTEPSRPSLVVCHTVIGRGAPTKAGTAEAHGAPLGEAELAAAKRALGWPAEARFLVPEPVRALWQGRREEWRGVREAWDELLGLYRAKHPGQARAFDRAVAGGLPRKLRHAVPPFPAGKAQATRSSGGEILNRLARAVPELVGGSADLAPSTRTELKGSPFLGPGRFGGRNIHFGVREHAMGHVSNGLALHGGFIPFCATFLVFADYMRPALRLAALMRRRVLFYYTHDSIFVGEDGPTHQPVEHLASLRSIPRLRVMRPCDANEAAEAFCLALERRDGPTAFSLTRQNLPTLDRTALAPASLAKRGAYILKEAPGGRPDLILLASGSEVHVALEAAARLEAEGMKPRVVSMVCMELFEEQPQGYRRKLLPRRVRRRVAIEASLDPHWDRYVGDKGIVVGLRDFGVSGPYQVLARAFGLTADGVLDRMRQAKLI